MAYAIQKQNDNVKDNYGIEKSNSLLEKKTIIENYTKRE